MSYILYQSTKGLPIKSLSGSGFFQMKPEQPAKVRNILPTHDPHQEPSMVISAGSLIPLTTRQRLGGCWSMSVTKPSLPWLLHNEEIVAVSKCQYHYVKLPL